MLTTKELGKLGEDLAVSFLKKQKIKILEINWRHPIGEIDIVASENYSIIFVEVKTRYDTPQARKNLLDNIHKNKQRKLTILAETYIKQKYQINTPPPYRIDIIGILINKESNQAEEIRHIRAGVGNWRC